MSNSAYGSSETSISGTKTLFTPEQQRLGKYRILAELGRGGAANVYLAVARGKGDVRKLVVLKALLSDLADEASAVSAFLDEARLAAQLNHPNVVQTYEVGTESDRHVIVMEYLQGQSLSRIIKVANRNGSVPLGHQLRVLIEMLEGLHYAHEVKALDGRPMRLVHRDVSPQNVFVTYDGQVKILDFGIAKAASSSTHTAAGIMKGKIAYMAPEQMAGTVLDRRADIYSAGCMLWAVAAGQKLWQDASDVQIVRAVVAGRIPSPRTVNPDCPESLERIVMRAVQADPEKRYATALELQSDLEQFCESEGLVVKQRDVGRYVSELFDDKRREFDESVEREYAAALATEVVHTELESRTSHTGPTRSQELASKPPQPGATKKRRLIIGGALLALLVAVFGSVAAMRGGSAEAGKPLAPNHAPVVATPPKPQKPIEQTQAAIRLAVVPDDARLTLDGKPLPANTTEVSLPVSGDNHTLIGEARDYETQTLVFKVSGDERLLLELKPTARGKRSPAPGHRVAAPAAIAPAPVAAPPPTPAACDNPFYVDAQGIKRVRAGCL